MPLRQLAVRADLQCRAHRDLYPRTIRDRTHVVRMCLCGKCDCCAVVAHVNKREETKPDPQKTALAVVIRYQNKPSGMAQ